MQFIFMEISGFEPLTFAVQKQYSTKLSYIPFMGYVGLEPTTIPLSGAYSDQLS